MALGTIFAGLAGGLGGLSKSLEEQEKLKRQQEALARQAQMDAQQRQQQQFLNEMATRQLGLQEQAAGDRRASDVLNQLSPNADVPPEIAALIGQSPIFQARTQTTQSPPSRAIGGTMGLPGPAPVESNLDVTERPGGVSRTIRKPTAAEQSSLDSRRALEEFLTSIDDPRLKGAIRAGVSPQALSYEDPSTKRLRDFEQYKKETEVKTEAERKLIQERGKYARSRVQRFASVGQEGGPLAGKPVWQIRDIDTQQIVDEIPMAPTTGARTKEEARGLVGRSVEAVRGLSEQLITKVGPAQRAIAAGRSVEAVLGHDPVYKAYKDARMALAGNLAVAQQGSRPSDADIKAIWLPMIPDAFSDTKDSAAIKWYLIDIMGLGKEGSPPPAMNQSGLPGGVKGVTRIK